MSKIDFGENCLLTQHLKEVSMVDYGYKGRFAGALLYAFDFPQYLKLPDTKYISYLLQELAKIKRTDLLSEATEKCVNCPHFDSCEVGALFLNK